MKKTVSGVYSSPKGHWVGDGFPVRSLFSYDGLGQQLSPFLLLDYAGPAHFAPATQPRGVNRPGGSRLQVRPRTSRTGPVVAAVRSSEIFRYSGEVDQAVNVSRSGNAALRDPASRAESAWVVELLMGL